MNEARSNPLVSIIVPSFNQGQFIEETLCSILNQTYQPLELIVVDGGSTDDTLTILKQYHGRLRWLSELDDGQADAVNKGFRLAAGDYIGWLNSDDLYFTRVAIAQIVTTFINNPQADVIYGDVAIISADSTLLRFRLVPPYDSARMVRRNTIPQPAVFFKRQVVQTEMLDVNQLALDYEYWLRLSAKGYKFQHVPLVLAADRNHQSRISVARKAELWQTVRTFRQQYAQMSRNGRWQRFFDRSAEALCRLRGVGMAIKLLRQSEPQRNFASPIQIDSPWHLLYRQLFKSVSDVF